MAQRPLCSGPQLIEDEERAGECRGAVREMVVALRWWCRWRCRVAGGSAAAAAQQRPVAQAAAGRAAVGLLITDDGVDEAILSQNF